MTSTRRDPELVRIGAVIRDRRERLREVRRDIADRAGIHPVTLKKIELGDQRASRLLYLRIADAIGMTDDEMDELTGQEVAVK